MKKLLLLVACVFTSLVGFSQNPTTTFTYGTSAVSTSGTVDLRTSGTQYHGVVWFGSGTVSTCQFTVDSSVDGTVWTTGGIIPAQTCTSNGSVVPGGTSLVANFLRVNVSTISGGGTISVVYNGFNALNSGGTSYITNSSDVAVTGFTTETVICAIKIPANTLSGTQDASGSRFAYVAHIGTAGGAGTAQIRLSLGTVPNSVGVTLVGPNAAQTTGRSYTIKFNCSNKSSASQVCSGNIINSTNLLIDSLSPDTKSIAADMYFVVSAIQTSAADTTTCKLQQVSIY